ncbi:MAG: hypothetical protein KGJ02_06480 [Verrucomicrobiota bacterium]|nr:hypothetical protein [Verrucomicrobiota bacterium]
MVTIFFQVKAFLLREQGRVVWRYYRALRFAALDLCFGLASLFFNPYRMCRKFLEKRGEGEVHAYGETPLTTFQTLATAAKLQSDDHYVELGSGRGKTCLWAAYFVGCSVEGIEWIPLLATLSQLFARLFRLPAHFHCQSIADADLSKASVVYLYTLDHAPELLAPLRSLRPGARLITISEPIEGFELLETVPVHFPWGETDAYIQRKCELPGPKGPGFRRPDEISPHALVPKDFKGRQVPCRNLIDSSANSAVNGRAPVQYT